MKPSFNIYVSSDQHFNHWAINRYCKRGFKSLQDMNSTMIKKWNRLVRPDDLIIHVGDLIFTQGASKNIIEILKQLNGRIILVRGNHDRKSYSYYMTNGIDFICERFSWYFNKKKILFIHSPHDVTYNDLKTCRYIIHGHSHDKGKFIHKNKQCQLINVSVENTKFAPLNLVTLLNRVKQGYYEKGSL